MIQILASEGSVRVRTDGTCILQAPAVEQVHSRRRTVQRSPYRSCGPLPSVRHPLSSRRAWVVYWAVFGYLGLSFAVLGCLGLSGLSWAALDMS